MQEALTPTKLTQKSSRNAKEEMFNTEQEKINRNINFKTFLFHCNNNNNII